MPEMSHWPPNTFFGAILSTVCFGWITPSINIEKELAEKHNLAVAIVTGAMILGAAIVIAAALVG